MRLIFVRHGEPNYEKDCLTERGRIEAALAAQRLLGENADTIFSSPQGRALETARALSERMGDKPIEVLDFMHEISWGSTDGEALFENGHPWSIADELVRQGCELTRTDWREHSLFRRNKATACADRIAEEVDKWLKGLGYERVGAYYRQSLDVENRRTYILFSHGGSSTAALAHILNLPFPYLLSLLHMPFTALNILRFDAEPGSVCQPHLELGCDASHIK